MELAANPKCKSFAFSRTINLFLEYKHQRLGIKIFLSPPSTFHESQCSLAERNVCLNCRENIVFVILECYYKIIRLLFLEFQMVKWWLLRYVLAHMLLNLAAMTVIVPPSCPPECICLSQTQVSYNNPYFCVDIVDGTVASIIYLEN